MMISFSIILFLSLQITYAKFTIEKFSMDKICGNNPIILDGDQRPGLILQLTNNNKYKSNLNCTIQFRTAQPSQRFIITIEKLDIIDCPNDILRIYDGFNLLNKELNQQCGSSSSSSIFSFTSTTNQISMIFTSNSVMESSGYQASIALHFSMIATCSQELGFFLCKNRNCISKQLQCDGRNHCGDNTDENQCTIIG